MGLVSDVDVVDAFLGSAGAVHLRFLPLWPLGEVHFSACPFFAIRFPAFHPSCLFLYLCGFDLILLASRPSLPLASSLLLLTSSAAWWECDGCFPLFIK